MAKDIVGNELSIGDWVVQLRTHWNSSTIEAENGVIVAIDDESDKVTLVSVYKERKYKETDFKDKEAYIKYVKAQEKVGWVRISKRKCGTHKVVLTYPDITQVNLIEKYEEASKKKLY